MTKEEEIRLNAMMQCLQQDRDRAMLEKAQLMGELAVLKMKLEEKPQESAS